MSWWVWVLAGFGIGAVELLAPGYLFVGFGLGALLTGGLVWSGLVGTGLQVQLTVFAVLSVVFWIALRRVLGIRTGQVKRINRDINEN